MKTICLVGNGNQILKYQLGKIIDKFDIVVRFNNFKIDSYEEYVGTKTDWWATRICSTIKTRNPSDFSRILGICNWCKFTPGIVPLIPSFIRQYPKLELIDFNKCKKYNKFFGYQYNKNWLSVGLITLLYLLETETRPIYIAGFGGDPSQHYFKQQPQDFKYHNFTKENQYVEDLVDAGKIIRLRTYG